MPEAAYPAESHIPITTDMGFPYALVLDWHSRILNLKVAANENTIDVLPF